MSSTRETWAAMLVVGLLLGMALFGPLLLPPRTAPLADEIMLGAPTP